MIVQEIISERKNKNKILKVAAYCRVSTDLDEQATSLEAQKDYYDSYIKNNPHWELVQIYYEQESALFLKNPY